jgi:glutamate 5-kinase
MAAHSGVPTIIASPRTPELIKRALAGEQVGTWVEPRTDRLSARKLWIAFGLDSAGSLVIDAGAVAALVEHDRSLLPVGITEVQGGFQSGAAVEVIDPDGRVVGRGLAAIPSGELSELIGQKGAREAIHRDDLVILR